MNDTMLGVAIGGGAACLWLFCLFFFNRSTKD